MSASSRLSLLPLLLWLQVLDGLLLPGPALSRRTPSRTPCPRAEASFSPGGGPEYGALGGETAAAAGVADSWDEAAWGESTTADGPAGSTSVATTADWLSPAAVSRPRRPIETVSVGIVSGPYKRRNGYHAEVAVQHPGGVPETTHRLWFGHEVVADVAKLRGRKEHAIDVERFAESVLRFLQAQGVDLADPDWGMQDDSVPFGVTYLPVRTLLGFYPDMAEALAAELLTPARLEDLDAAEAATFIGRVMPPVGGPAPVAVDDMVEDELDE